MISLVLMPVCLLVLYGVITLSGEARSRVMPMLIAGYLARMAFQFVARYVPIFNGVAGGDSVGYEMVAEELSIIWDHRGIHYIDSHEVNAVGQASLPVNLFAFVIYANGGPAQEGCTAIIALCACISALNIYKLCLDIEIPKELAYRAAAIFLFLPSFVMYTSDIYKDGLVIFFALGGLFSAIRLARRFTLVHAVIGVLSLWSLYYVRAYLVFACVAPYLVGVSGVDSKSLARPLMVTLALISGVVALGTYTNVLVDASEHANQQFDVGTSWRVLAYADKSGSGVRFDDGGNIYGALHQKIAYALMAPFPWQAGSVGFHIGKIDSMVTTYFLYRSVRAAIRHWKERRGFILTLISFIVPMTFVYAVGMYNIGLTVRQRLPIVALLFVLGSLSWVPTKAELAKQRANDETADDEPDEPNETDEPGEHDESDEHLTDEDDAPAGRPAAAQRARA
jgi:hypothetical protein